MCGVSHGTLGGHRRIPEYRYERSAAAATVHRIRILTRGYPGPPKRIQILFKRERIDDKADGILKIKRRIPYS